MRAELISYLRASLVLSHGVLFHKVSDLFRLIVQT